MTMDADAPGEPEEVLHGGVANAGAVVRVGQHVLRPASAHTPSVHRLLRHLHAVGFTAVPVPVGVEEDGRERLEYVPGDVASPPYPAWVQTDDALASVARILRGMHDAAASFGTLGEWSAELADPAGGPVMCHNDVCLENVVFREGVAVALLDFDFAAPGRPLYDVAAFARLCVPLDADEHGARLGWAEGLDRPGRLRVVTDAYGLDRAQRLELVDLVEVSMRAGEAFVARRVAAGEPAFVEMFHRLGGAARLARRRAWWAEESSRFSAAL